MRTLRELRNTAKGQRAFVLGNSPSILDEPLDRLAGELVIGMNGSTLLEESHGIRQTFYTLGDLRFLTSPTKRPLATSGLHPETRRVLRSDLLPNDDVDLADRTWCVTPLGRDGFSPKLSSGFYHGCTTAMLAIQLAVWLGCQEIVLLGVDLHYPAGQPRFYAEEVPQEEDVFTSVQVRNLAAAGQACERLGVKVAITSRRSMLRPYLPLIPLVDATGDTATSPRGTARWA